MEHQRRANGRPIPKEALKQQRVRKAMQALYVVLVVAVFIGVYSVVDAAVDRFHWKLDLTEGRVFQLTETTEEVLAGVEKDVTVLILNNEKDADTNIAEVLSRYEAASSRIRVDYLDMELNPAVVEEYRQKGVSLSEDGVLVLCGDYVKFIQWSDLYEIRTTTGADGGQSYSITGLKAETRLTAAILEVTTQEISTIAFTAGHSESAPEALEDLIAANNYRAQRLVLGVDAIDETVETIVIAGAKLDFSPGEIQLLDEYMARGGNLMVFREPGVESLPNLDSYLAEWGLTVTDQVVLEPRQQMDSPMNIIPEFGVSMINVRFSEEATYLVLPKSRGIETANLNGCVTNTVLRSTSSSYGKSFSALESLTQAAEDRTGPFTLAATSERSFRTAEGEEKTQYVFLTACTGLYQESYLKTESIGNADFVVEVLSYMNDHAVTLNIPAKNLATSAITVSWGMAVLFAAVFIVLIPCGLLLAGIRQYLKRRHV